MVRGVPVAFGVSTKLAGLFFFGSSRCLMPARGLGPRRLIKNGGPPERRAVRSPKATSPTASAGLAARLPAGRSTCFIGVGELGPRWPRRPATRGRNVPAGGCSCRSSSWWPGTSCSPMPRSAPFHYKRGQGRRSSAIPFISVSRNSGVGRPRRLRLHRQGMTSTLGVADLRAVKLAVPADLQTAGRGRAAPGLAGQGAPGPAARRFNAIYAFVTIARRAPSRCGRCCTSIGGQHGQHGPDHLLRRGPRPWARS